MENILLYSVYFGIFGGLIRALVGIIKYFEKNKSEKKIRLWYLVFSLLVAAFVGGVTGALANTADWRLALVIGYAGTDFLESLYKIKEKQRFQI